MNGLGLVVLAMLVLAVAYRLYGAFLRAKVFALAAERTTPAVRFEDGKNFHATNRWVVFGHHFAAIAGAGPLVGPVLAAQFGYLTTVDAGTRVARYLIQEVSGRIHPRLADVNHWPSVIATSVLVSGAWGYMLYQNDVSSIWPMFGVANQLLAVLALIIGTGWLLRHAPRRRHALITALPAAFMVVTTITAALANLFDSFLPRGRAGDFNGYVNTGLTVVMLACVVIVLVDGSARSWMLLRGGGPRASA